MTDLSQDELTCLMIAAEGQSLIAIGRWEKPLASLVQRGLVTRHDKANHSITDAGRLALADEERKTDHALGQMIEGSSRIGSEQARIRAQAEQMAQTLATMANDSSRITRDATTDAARKWSDIVLNRALEILGAR